MNAANRLVPLGLRGWRAADARGDLVAGLTLAAVAVPECMATARLAGLAPEFGLLAFVTASFGFALAGASRSLSAGPDSTIAPVFGGALAALGVAGGSYAPALALAVGLLLVVAGLGRLGFLANLLSRPVLTGFLAGIAVRIAASQAPALVGVHVAAETVPARIAALAGAMADANPGAVAIGVGIVGAVAFGERARPRVPWMVLAVAAATLATSAGGHATASVPVLGTVATALPHLAWPTWPDAPVATLGPLALLVAALVLMQTGAVSRAFGPDGADATTNRDVAGLGAANLAAGLLGAFPVNASPARTGVATAAGGRSQWTGVVAAGIVVALVLAGSGLLARVPVAALAAVLLLVAWRLVDRATIVRVARSSRGEFALLAATALAVTLLPIQAGVSIGIALSLAHGLWSTTRADVVRFERVEGTSVWWPVRHGAGPPAPGPVVVIGFQAPLSFLNASTLAAGMLHTVQRADAPPRLVVIEAGSVPTIDFTAAEALARVVRTCRANGIDVAIARLESVRGVDQFERLGLLELFGTDHVHRSVADAIAAHAPSASASPPSTGTGA
jgi:MFS superfamily sulfate permease-like transporter